jgi:hypothetical protein
VNDVQYIYFVVKAVSPPEAKIFGHNYKCFQVQPVTREHLSVFLQQIGVYSLHVSETIDNLLELLNINWSFLKFNQFICN